VAISMTMIARGPKGSTQNRHMVVPIQATISGMGVGAVNPFGVRRGIRR